MNYVPPTYHCFYVSLFLLLVVSTYHFYTSHCLYLSLYVLFAHTPPMSIWERELVGLCFKYSLLFICSVQQPAKDDSYATNAMVAGKGMMGENKRKRREQVGHLCCTAVVRNKHIIKCFSIEFLFTERE